MLLVVYCGYIRLICISFSNLSDQSRQYQNCHSNKYNKLFSQIKSFWYNLSYRWLKFSKLWDGIIDLRVSKTCQLPTNPRIRCELVLFYPDLKVERRLDQITNVKLQRQIA
jgi:hypothetical protein